LIPEIITGVVVAYRQISPSAMVHTRGQNLRPLRLNSLKPNKSPFAGVSILELPPFVMGATKNFSKKELARIDEAEPSGSFGGALRS
jgi:hypothetical protein